MRSFDLMMRVFFGLAGAALMLLALAMIIYAGFRISSVYFPSSDVTLGSRLLEAVGYTIIAIAVFDVGKYLIEEDAIRAREMRQPGEARRSMTKFISTIAIAVFLESLVAVFEASKKDMALMLYPTLLLLAGVALVVGLGAYQRLSVTAEKEVATTPEVEDDQE